jgi:hypothetical protein
MQQAIADRVGQGRVAEVVVPLRGGSWLVMLVERIP